MRGHGGSSWGGAGGDPTRHMGRTKARRCTSPAQVTRDRQEGSPIQAGTKVRRKVGQAGVSRCSDLGLGGGGGTTPPSPHRRRCYFISRSTRRWPEGAKGPTSQVRGVLWATCSTSSSIS